MLLLVVLVFISISLSYCESNRMNIAIIFASKHGAVSTVVDYMKNKINDAPVTVFDAKHVKRSDIENFDTYIVGGSIYAGSIQGYLSTFLTSNEDLFSQKRLALFLSCMNKPQQQEAFDRAYPETLRSSSIHNSFVGGEIIMTKLNWFERFLTRVFGKTTESVSDINYDEIDQLIVAVKTFKSS
ncbi:hypothetical protein GEMRC1_005439 [Eukaryota sp. GEM-RC1]